MSRASERKAMVETLAGYSLMGVPKLAAFLDCSEAVVRALVDDGVIPSTRVGGRSKVDPMDAAVHLLAGREGLFTSAGHPDHAAYWTRHGEATAEHVRRYVTRIRRATGAAA
jgi:hypothetical protein